jgi:hypothetical protein
MHLSSPYGYTNPGTRIQRGAYGEEALFEQIDTDLCL